MTVIKPLPFEAVNVPPLVQIVPTLIVCVAAAVLQVIVPPELIVTKVETVRVRAVVLLPIERVPVPLIVSDRQAAAVTFSFTVKPPSIITLSLAVGTLAPEPPPEVADQVDVKLQLPEATEYRSAPNDSSELNATVKMTRSLNSAILFIPRTNDSTLIEFDFRVGVNLFMTLGCMA
jgi:hypothetical protein